MAFLTNTAPMFMPEPELLSALRLDGLDELQAKTGPTTIVRNAIRNARVVFVDRLGLSAVAALQAIPRSDDPATAEEISRWRAELLEVLVVKRRLVQDLPILFMDGARHESTIWNEEGLTRHADPLSDLLKKLDEEIDDGFGALDTDPDTVGGSVQAASFGSEADPVPEPGFTLEHQPYNPWLRPNRGAAFRGGVFP